MRTLPPETDGESRPTDGESRPLEEPARRELIFRMILPLRLFGEVYFLGFLMGRDLAHGAPPEKGRIKGHITAAAIFLVLLCVVLSGSFFLLYLIKSLMGFDLFTHAHLME